jgi:hypothetical protein
VLWVTPVEKSQGLGVSFSHCPENSFTFFLPAEKLFICVRKDTLFVVPWGYINNTLLMNTSKRRSMRVKRSLYEKEEYNHATVKKAK